MSRRRSRRDGTTQIFAGLVKCADCGWSMSFVTNRQNKTPTQYFHCSRYSQSIGYCTQHYIRYDVIYTYVLARVRYWAKQAEIDEDALLQSLLKTGDKEHLAASKKQASNLAKAEKRKTEVDRLFAGSERRSGFRRGGLGAAPLLRCGGCGIITAWRR